MTLEQAQSKLQEMASRLNDVHRKIAADVFPNVNRAYCPYCGYSEPVEPAYCIAHGWPTWLWRNHVDRQASAKGGDG